MKLLSRSASCSVGQAVASGNPARLSPPLPDEAEGPWVSARVTPGLSVWRLYFPGEYGRERVMEGRSIMNHTFRHFRIGAEGWVGRWEEEGGGNGY